MRGSLFHMQIASDLAKPFRIPPKKVHGVHDHLQTRLETMMPVSTPANRSYFIPPWGLGKGYFNRASYSSPLAQFNIKKKAFERRDLW